MSVSDVQPKVHIFPGKHAPRPLIYYVKKSNCTPPEYQKKSNISLRKKIINYIHFHNKKMECLLPLTALKLSPLNYLGSFILLLQVMFA